jgi:hypothetical protein
MVGLAARFISDVEALAGRRFRRDMTLRRSSRKIRLLRHRL